MLFIEEELSSIFWLLLVSIGDSELATVSVSLLLEVFTLLLDDSFSSPLLEETSALDEDPFKLLEDRAKLEEDFALPLEDVSASLLSLELLLDLPMLLEDSFIEEASLSLEDSGSAITDDDGSSGTTGLFPDDLSSPHPVRKTNVNRNKRNLFAIFINLKQ